MLDCGFSPLMTSLSDRNMSLGVVLLPPGRKQQCLYLRVQGLFNLCKVLLMQLSVALGLHFGWGSQLNTCVFNPVNGQAVVCSPRIAILSSVGRETSLVNFMGPFSIFPPLLTPSLYFPFYF